MEKKYIRKPFDIELAKKIQSGEIEGRIVTNSGGRARIIGFYKRTLNVIVSHDHLCESLGSYNTNGELTRKTCGDDYLVIELPEKEPKPDSFSRKLHDTAEVLATPKHEFKEGDIVKVVRGDKEVGCVGSIYAPMYAGQGGIIGWIVIVEKGRRANGILTENMEPASEKEIEIYKNTKVDPKHEFRPFEQVLVREEWVWVPRLYGYSEHKHLSDMDETFHIMTDGKTYLECIPFKGNEHLVGKTEIPKEE